MSRDHTKLPVFQKADALVLEVFRRTENLPAASGIAGTLGPVPGLREELRSQTLHAVCAIVDSCLPMRQKADFAHCMDMSLGDFIVARYKASVAVRLGLIENGADLIARFDEVVTELNDIVSKAE